MWFNDCFNVANDMCELDNINVAGPLHDINMFSL